MAGASTRHALGRRAMQAASVLEFWTKELQDELKKQNIELSLSSDDPTPITLSLGTVSAMVAQMRELIREIRFAD